ncbi:MAG: type III-B CRISPR module-associated protein Cmr5 [Clostridia bacterium]|nr:type III-B CRISPR module-associated protein Cmr5 [Clostridia bacterium]
MAAEETKLREKIENGRAAFAFQKVKSFVQANSEKAQKDYRSYIKKLPAMIQVNGLGQSLAFCYAKGTVYGNIYHQIEEWIKIQQPALLNKYDPEGSRNFVETVVNMNSRDYRLISNEVMAYLNWMRRFVDGMIKAD